jgi:hypothetical protein
MENMEGVLPIYGCSGITNRTFLGIIMVWFEKDSRRINKQSDEWHRVATVDL